MLLSPVKCCGIWSLPWPDTLCLLMYSGLVWLMLQCCMSLLAAEALKPSLYTDCFSNSDPWSHSGETGARDRTSACRCEGVGSGINRCQRYCAVSGWPVTTTECVVLLSFPWPRHKPIPTFLQRARQRVFAKRGTQLGFQHSAAPMMHL